VGQRGGEGPTPPEKGTFCQQKKKKITKKKKNQGKKGVEGNLRVEKKKNHKRDSTGLGNAASRGENCLKKISVKRMGGGGRGVDGGKQGG